jgi:hypothetical protein
MTYEQFLTEADGTMYYEVSINKELIGLASTLLKDDGYTIKQESDDILVTPKQNQRLAAFQNMLYAMISKEFEDGNETMVKFVGSSKTDDLINSDLNIEVNAVYK